MATNIRKCKHCKVLFTKQKSLQFLCSPKCAVDYGKIEKVKSDKQAWKIEKAKMIDKLKTTGDYEADLQAVVNSIVRLIDRGCSCLSCGRDGKPQAGHFHSRGANKTIRFHLDNIHIQDYYCNVELSGNIIGYNIGLNSTYGSEYQRFVEVTLPKKFPLIKWVKHELMEWISKAKALKKEIEKIDHPLIPMERLALRSRINNELGIYKTQ